MSQETEERTAAALEAINLKLGQIHEQLILNHVDEKHLLSMFIMGAALSDSSKNFLFSDENKKETKDTCLRAWRYAKDLSNQIQL